jgi:hypothetical protein
MQLVEPFLEEQWIVDGVASATRPKVDSLYIKPLLQSLGLSGTDVVRHSLVLDNNVLADLIESRRPANNEFLERLLKSRPIELNPVVAFLEQRQKFSGATKALADYRDYLARAFGHHISDQNLAALEKSLEDEKPALISNIETLAGYLSLTIYLYHQNWSIEKKLETLAGLVCANNLPVFQLHFYFAALVFLVGERVELFDQADVKKVRKDMTVAKSVDEHWVKVRNLANDLAFPALSLFYAGLGPGALVFPYAATRDRLCQLLLSQVSCAMVMAGDDGRANGLWMPSDGSLLKEQLGTQLDFYIPRRKALQEAGDVAIRSANVRAFADRYVKMAVVHHGGQVSPLS